MSAVVGRRLVDCQNRDRASAAVAVVVVATARHCPRTLAKKTWRANLKARLTDLDKNMSVALEAAVDHLSEPVEWL